LSPSGFRFLEFWNRANFHPKIPFSTNNSYHPLASAIPGWGFSFNIYPVALLGGCELGQNTKLLLLLIFKKGDVTRGVHGKKKARVYYLSYCIVLTYSD
jgi:hypothetical protein